jgi:hypothetical protein
MSMTKVASATTRKRGRGTTPAERKASRAAFKAHDTRLAMAAAERRATKRAAAKRKRS